MEALPRGADLVVQALAQAGAGPVFTLSGNHIMPLFDAALETGAELLHVRHEAACVHMADAWARLTGGVGVAMVTGGPGLGNAVGALATSLAGETPVVLISGHAPLRQCGTGAFQEMDQAGLAAPVTKASWVAASAAAVAQDVARACAIARTGRPGPVHLALPADLLDARPESPVRPAAAAFAPRPMPLGAGTARLVRTTLAQARRPLVIAPPSLCSADGRRRLRALRDATGVPVVAMESPRGINDPALGAFAEVLAEADLIVLAAKPLDFTLGFGRPPVVAADAAWIVADPDPALLARAGLGLGNRLLFTAAADAGGTVAGLIAAGGERARDPGWSRAVEAAIAHRPAECLQDVPQPGGGRHPAAMCRAALPALAGGEAVLVSDGGEVGQWAQAVLSAEDRLINGVAGAIGPAIPFAIAARRARPRATVLAVLGDGTMGFHMAEFDTAVRYGLAFVALVGNDSRWNAEHQIQLRDYGAARAHGCALAPDTRYDLVAAALGGHGEFVGPEDDLPAAIGRALASGRPACVNVAIAGIPAPVARRGGDAPQLRAGSAAAAG